LSKIKIFSLGGLNENGKNMYIVEVDKDIFVFDAGLKYGNEQMLGIDYILPDYSYLIENEKRIKGIFLTHGHESNMGAMADILMDLKNVNVYATKYTMQILKKGKFINPPKEFISDNEKKYLSDLINNVSIEEKDDLIIYYHLILLVELVLKQYK